MTSQQRPSGLLLLVHTAPHTCQSHRAQDLKYYFRRNVSSSHPEEGRRASLLLLLDGHSKGIVIQRQLDPPSLPDSSPRRSNLRKLLIPCQDHGFPLSPEAGPESTILQTGSSLPPWLDCMVSPVATRVRNKCLGQSLVDQAPVASTLLSRITGEGRMAFKKAPRSQEESLPVL